RSAETGATGSTSSSACTASATTVFPCLRTTPAPSRTRSSGVASGGGPRRVTATARPPDPPSNPRAPRPQPERPLPESWGPQTRGSIVTVARSSITTGSLRPPPAGSAVARAPSRGGERVGPLPGHGPGRGRGQEQPGRQDWQGRQGQQEQQERR